MLKTRSSRIILVERIIIAWALMATVTYFVQKVTVNYTFDYGFLFRPAIESRYSDLAQTLAAVGKAFYIADPMAGQPAETSRNRELLARYFLAPYLTSNADALYEVADFQNQSGLQQWAKNRHVKLIRNFQNGLALFKKEGAP